MTSSSGKHSKKRQSFTARDFNCEKATSPRYKGSLGGRRDSPEPKQQGYNKTSCQQAVKRYSDGMNVRRIAPHLGVNHQTVINSVNASSAQWPCHPLI